MENQKDEILDAVFDLIEWYKNNSTKAGIDMLLDFQDKLSTYTANLSELYVKYSLGYNLSYIERKYTTAVNKAKARDNMNVSDANDYAEKTVKNLRKNESYNYEIAQRLQMIRQDARMILNLCIQRISYLKLERETVKNQTT